MDPWILAIRDQATANHSQPPGDMDLKAELLRVSLADSEGTVYPYKTSIQHLNNLQDTKNWSP